MRRKDKIITSEKEVEEILKTARICRIAINDKDAPYLVPVCYGYERGAIYFHSALQGKKIDLLQRNNNVCFEVEDGVELKTSRQACGFGMKYRSVIGRGIAVRLERPAEKLDGLNVLMRQFTGKEFPIPDNALSNVAVFRIDVEEMTGKSSP